MKDKRWFVAVAVDHRQIPWSPFLWNMLWILSSHFKSKQLSLCFTHQNPPGLPSISVAWFVSFLRGSRLIIDWHNYGYTIMALSHGQGHPVVRLAKRSVPKENGDIIVIPFTFYLLSFAGMNASLALWLLTTSVLPTRWRSTYRRTGGSGDVRFTITNLSASSRIKQENSWKALIRCRLSLVGLCRATTLYDRPASSFRETPLELQHQLFMKLASTHPQFQSSMWEALPSPVDSEAHALCSDCSALPPPDLSERRI